MQVKVQIERRIHLKLIANRNELKVKRIESFNFYLTFTYSGFIHSTVSKVNASLFVFYRMSNNEFTYY